MRILAWNVRGGSDPSVAEAVCSLSPDVVVLADCRPSHYVGIAGQLRSSGYSWVTGANEGDYTGLMIASRSPMGPGSTASRVLPGRWCHVRLRELGTSIVGIYGPLAIKGKSRLVPSFWSELIQVEPMLRAEHTLIAGDLNTASHAKDTSSGQPLPAGQEMQQVLDQGWRDAFREANGDRQEFSY